MQLKITRPLPELKDSAYAIIKLNLYNFIIKESNFPEWKQANYALRYSELGLKELAQTISTNEQAELTAIRQIIDWKNGLLVERDRVKMLIYAAADALQIRAATDGMIHTSSPFAL